MIARRQFLLGSAAMVSGLAAMPGCSIRDEQFDYQQAVRQTWQQEPRIIRDPVLLQRELVRYATLAPSSHNTQCWRFRLEPSAITVLPDMTRRCPVVDPDDHHLFVSLGCAVQNLVEAAGAYGLHADLSFTDAAALRVTLVPTNARESPLFRAIPARQSTRTEYDSKSLSTEELKLLEQAGTGQGVQVILLDDTLAMETTLEYVIQGNTAQFNDPSFVQELKKWIRFSETEAVATGDGLFSRSLGDPVIPRWLGDRIFDWVVTAKKENDKYAAQLRSSAGIIVFVSEANDRAHWIEVGRCYERFALQSAVLGIRNAFLNQPVEVSALRPQFSSYLGIADKRPDLVVRFGRGPTMPPSLRRSVADVILV